MQIKHRIAASLLMMPLYASGLFSCGNKPPSVTTAIETETTAETLVSADYNGYEFNIFGERQTTLSDYFYVEEQTGEIIDDSVYERNAAVEEKYNIKLKFTLVDWKQGSDMIKTYILAGDDTFDLYTCTQLYIGSLVVGRYFADWNHVDSVNLESPWYVKKANETLSIGNETPLLFGDFMESNILRCWNYIFNKRLADENNLEDLYTVVDEGRWTVDFLMGAIKDLARDINGDSQWTKEDFYGLCADKFGTLDAFSRSLKLNPISKDADNLPVLSYYNENVVTAFEKVYDLYYSGNAAYIADKSLAHINDVFAVGNAVFSAFRIDQLMNAEIRDMKDDYGVLPYPKLDENAEGYGTYLSGTFSAQMIGINQPESDRERTGNITEALNAYSHELVVPAIYEVTLKTKTSRDERSIDMLDLILESRTYSFDSCDEDNFPLSPTGTIRTLIGGRKSKDIASYYASVEAKAREWIDTMIKAYTGS